MSWPGGEDRTRLGRGYIRHYQGSKCGRPDRDRCQAGFASEVLTLGVDGPSFYRFNRMQGRSRGFCTKTAGQANGQGADQERNQHMLRPDVAC